YMFVLPYTIFLSAFGIAPVLYALRLSFAAHGHGVFNVSLSSYRYAIQDPDFMAAARHVLEFAAFVTPICLLMVTILALTLHARPAHVGRTFALGYFLPAAVSGSVVVLIWLFMLDPAGSPYRSILRGFGLHTVTDIVNRTNYLYIFSTMFLWSSVGGWIVITHAALKNVSQEIVGAAKIDGCGALALGRHIYVPMIRKTLLLMTVLVFAAASQVYNEPTVLSTFTDDTVPWALNQLSYRLAFQFGFFQASAAVAIMLVGLTLLLAIPLVWRFDFLRDGQQ